MIFMNVNILKKLTTFSIMLAWFVVMLGAYTRLTDAGLGCPDWPGCYGQLVLPTDQSQLNQAQLTFPEIAIESGKAWTEMAHRYVAGTLGFLIALIFLRASVFRRKSDTFSKRMPVLLMGLVIFQALLGMWTVTLKLLPIVVMGHLLGGLLIFTTLCYFRWQLRGPQSNESGSYRYLFCLGFVVVFVQIALGGWVSSNYAGIACVGFPACNGLLLPELNLSQAFHLFAPIGNNYQGGLLPIDARITIQFVHRLGAIVTALLVYFICFFAIKHYNNRALRLVAVSAIFLISLQFLLGILNVVYLLPLGVAVAHNGVAALILASMASLIYLSKGASTHAIKG
tara:strand:- start:9 stop:1028 length:1020 start_codon:yes stop_codon:yes gene_type:complete